jgi:hypothetical protein
VKNALSLELGVSWDGGARQRTANRARKTHSNERKSASINQSWLKWPNNDSVG